MMRAIFMGPCYVPPVEEYRVSLIPLSSGCHSPESPPPPGLCGTAGMPSKESHTTSMAGAAQVLELHLSGSGTWEGICPQNL